MVGEKKSSQAITEEYAKADPIYIAKTAVSIEAGNLLPRSIGTSLISSV